MARSLELSLGKKIFAVRLERVGREKLYGDIEIEAFDDEGNEAFLQILDADGRTLIDTGGTSLAVVDEDGNSVDRKELTAIDSDGEKIEPVESSFKQTNKLKPATAEDYLCHAVKSVYYLAPADGASLDLPDGVVKGEKIYAFDFSYRGGLGFDRAFLVGNGKDAFLVVGVETSINFVKLNQPSILDTTEEEGELAGDELDFDLM
jgi:hypothetical protein